jgi:hypothetical protein
VAMTAHEVVTEVIVATAVVATTAAAATTVAHAMLATAASVQTTIATNQKQKLHKHRKLTTTMPIWNCK